MDGKGDGHHGRTEETVDLFTLRRVWNEGGPSGEMRVGSFRPNPGGTTRVVRDTYVNNVVVGVPLIGKGGRGTS